MAPWDQFLTILRAELDPEIAGRIEARIRAELGGLRLTIPDVHRVVITDEELRRTLREHRWNVDATAQATGLHRVTIYRRLAAKKPPRREEDGYSGGRLVR